LKKLRGKFTIPKKIRGQIAISWKFIGVNLKILENLRIKMKNLKNYENGKI